MIIASKMDQLTPTNETNVHKSNWDDTDDEYEEILIHMVAALASKHIAKHASRAPKRTAHLKGRDNNIRRTPIQ